MKLREAVVSFRGAKKAWEATIASEPVRDERYVETPVSLRLVIRFPDEAMLREFLTDTADPEARDA